MFLKQERPEMDDLKKKKIGSKRKKFQYFKTEGGAKEVLR